MRAYLKAKGIAVPAKLTNEAGTLSFTIQDPDGHPIQFIQRNNERPAATVQNHERQPDIRGILHVGLTIGAPATANSFYETILGFSEIWRGRGQRLRHSLDQYAPARKHRLYPVHAAAEQKTQPPAVRLPAPYSLIDPRHTKVSRHPAG